MIVDVVRGDVFAAGFSHVVFGINTGGWNGSGFAGQAVAAVRGWDDINSGKPLGLGALYSASGQSPVDDRWIEFHGIVVHGEAEGWVPSTITDGLNVLALRSGVQRAAVVLMGAGLVGQLSGADVFENLGAIARSRLEAVVFSL